MENINPNPSGNMLLEANARPMEVRTAAGQDWTTAPAKPPGQERQYHLDALRSILMVLGVFLHASYLYASREPWLVKDNDSSRLLLWVNEAIHFFRIPCFFILSGFFAQMLIKKQGEGSYLRSRMRRLALPLMATAVFINTLQAYYLHSNRTGTEGLPAYLGSGHYARFWTSGEWVGHLWFLVYVLGYSAAAAGLWVAWKTLRPHAGRAWTRARSVHPASAHLLRTHLLRGGLFMLLLPLPHFAVFASTAFLPFLYWNWGGLSGYAFLQSFPYFAFGLMLFLDKRLREEFQRLRPWQLLSIPAAVALEILLHRQSEGILVRCAIFYLDAYLVWTCCASLFALFRHLLSRKYGLFTYLSEASYSIYLFHHVCVVAMGLLMAGKQWGVFLEYWFVVGVSLAISLAAHHYLVLRIRVFRLLFMGK